MDVEKGGTLRMRFPKMAFCLTFLAASLMPGSLQADEHENEVKINSGKVNLALRRTADKLLRLSGDNTSRIAPVEQTRELTWRIQLHQTFRYDTLPYLLQASLQQYGIDQPYEVTVRQCADDIIALGFHQADLLQDSLVPCTGRELPQDCHYIEVTFVAGNSDRRYTSATGLLVLILLGAGGGWWWLRRKIKPVASTHDDEADWISFGRSRLHSKGLLLDSNGARQSLTYREAKLLRLFAEHPDQLLERDVILQQVWADEGVQVGRSIDMFVSRLRKKLQADPTLGLVAVHGVGYRLEVKRA